MRKTLFLLSTMILASGGIKNAMPVVTSTNEQGRVNEMAKTILNNDPISGNKLSLLAENGQNDEIFLTENDVNSKFNILSVDFKSNQIGVRIYEREGWQIKRVVMAYRNYEGGVTEAEADASLATLGEKDDEKWKGMWDYDAKGVPSLYHYMVPREDGKVVKIGENLTDVLYYAVEYGTKTSNNGTEWENEWWSRGKINYRNCVHSSVFDPETMICVNEGDGTYGVRTSDYDMIEMPVETVISWNEEWNAVQLQRYREMQERLGGLKNDLYNLLDVLDGVDKVLAGLEVTLPKSEGMDNLEMIKVGNTKLQELSKELREYFTNLDGGSAGEAEIKRLEREKEELLTKNNTLTTEKKMLEDEMEQIKRENSELKVKIEELEKGDSEGSTNIGGSIGSGCAEAGDSTGSVNDGEENKGVTNTVTVTERVRELVPVAETKVVTIEKEAEKKTNITEMENNETSVHGQGNATELEVPNLGSVEDAEGIERGARMNWLWILIAGTGIIGMTILSVQRMRQNKRK